MIKRISHGLGLDLNFFLIVECFLSPRQAQDRKFTTCCCLIKTISNPKAWEILYNVDIELIPEMVYPILPFRKSLRKIKFLIDFYCKHTPFKGTTIIILCIFRSPESLSLNFAVFKSKISCYHYWFIY